MLAILHNAGVVDLDATVVEQAHQLNSFHRSCTHIAILIQPTQVELVPGYGVYLTKRQLDEAMDQCCNTLPTT